MPQISDKVIKLINELVAALERDNIQIQRVILFGSYANGKYDEWSDIDLALVSDKFSGSRWDDKNLLREYRAKISWNIQALPYTPDDFYSDWFVREEILKKGVDIALI
jgi:uncharacterized protein